MRIQLPRFGAAMLACCLAHVAAAQSMTPTPFDAMGKEIDVRRLIDVEIRTTQNEYLGQIKDLGIDLVNGRIVEVLVVTDRFLGFGGKVIAVPPLALTPNATSHAYTIDMSKVVFQSAPAIDLSDWKDLGRTTRIARAYRYFGQEPYFLETGMVSGTYDNRPKLTLGYVERSSKILGLPVVNKQGQSLGSVWATTLNVPRGRIRSVIIVAAGNLQTKSVVPAMALSFNTDRTGLVLDDTITQYSDEPRLEFTAAQNGQKAHTEETSYKGPQTDVALVQGAGRRDENFTAVINKQIVAEKIDARDVEVGTINERVTLRGSVNSDEDKRRLGAIAIAATRLEVVDNQIEVVTTR